MAKTDSTLLLEGRLNDGFAVAIDLEGGTTVRVCDHDPPASLWARIEAAKKKAESVTFSGCRAEPNGKVDGFAIFPAARIVGLRNWGASVMGAGSMEIAALSAKVDELAAALAGAVNEIGEIQEDLDALEGEEENEGDEKPAGLDVPLAPETAAALRGAMGSAEEDGESGVPVTAEASVGDDEDDDEE